MMSFGFLFILVLWISGIAISVLSTAFWIWMIVDCLCNEPSHGNEKLVWLLLIVLLPFIGSLLYFFIRRPNRPITAEAIFK